MTVSDQQWALFWGLIWGLYGFANRDYRGATRQMKSLISLGFEQEGTARITTNFAWGARGRGFESRRPDF